MDLASIGSSILGAASALGIDSSNGGYGEEVTKDISDYVHSRVFATPYQFLPTTDIRSEGSPTGRLFGNNILGEAPKLSIVACRPRYLPSVGSDEEKKGIMKLLVDKSAEMVGSVADSVAGSFLETADMKFYSCELDVINYYRYVNTLCRSVAIFMGVGDLLVPGTDVPYSDFNWLNWRYVEPSSGVGEDTQKNLDEITDAAKQYLQGEMSAEDLADTSLKIFSEEQYYTDYYVTPSTSYSESFSNNTQDSIFKQLVDKGEGLVKELHFMLSSGGIERDDIKDSLSRAGVEMGEIMSKLGGSGNSLFARILGSANLILSGSNLIFPKIWHDSQWSKNYRIEIKLTSPYGNRLAIYKDIMVPLMHLLCLVLPRQTSVNSYGSPFLVKAHVDKWFSCEMGMVESLEIQKSDFTADGFPKEVVVSMNIEDLYSSLAMANVSYIPVVDGGPTNALGFAYNFLNNDSLIEYLSVISGLNIKISNWAKKMQLAKAIATQAAVDTVQYSGFAVRQEMARKAAHMLGRS
jgi:hypothetical protein